MLKKKYASWTDGCTLGGSAVSPGVDDAPDLAGVFGVLGVLAIVTVMADD